MFANANTQFYFKSFVFNNFIKTTVVFILNIKITLYYTESNGKLPHLFIPSKTATLVSEFAVENLPLSRTAALVPEFAVKDLLLGRLL